MTLVNGRQRERSEGEDNMPTPNKNETEKDFISRCVPYVLKEKTAKTKEQAVAICYSIWRRSKGKKEPKKKSSVEFKEAKA